MYTAMAAMQGWGNHMDWGGWGMMFGWTLILVVLILVIWAVADGRWPRRDEPGGRGRDRAEEALREQYARGEIDEETYRRRLNELRRD